MYISRFNGVKYMSCPPISIGKTAILIGGANYGKSGRVTTTIAAVGLDITQGLLNENTVTMPISVITMDYSRRMKERLITVTPLTPPNRHRYS